MELLNKSQNATNKKNQDWIIRRKDSSSENGYCSDKSSKANKYLNPKLIFDMRMQNFICDKLYFWNNYEGHNRCLPIDSLYHFKSNKIISGSSKERCLSQFV